MEDETGITGLYQYRGTFQVNTEVDRGTIDLALVPTWTDPAIDEFTDYSVGSLWETGIANWIKADAGLMADINVYAEPNIDAGSTNPEVIDALLDVQAALDPGESSSLDNLLFVILLTNPACFDNQVTNGFVGTASLDPPDWASELPVSEPLEIERDQQSMPVMDVDFGDMPAEPPPAT